MTTPPDDETLAAGLRRLTVYDPLPQLDPDVLVTRGRRGVRRRRWAAAALTSGLVVAVVVTGTVLRPALSAEPDIAGDPSVSNPTVSAGPLARLPGVRPGEAALGQLAAGEADRRCALRHPGQGGLATSPGLRAGLHVPFLMASRAGMYCLVPGDSRPTEEGRRLATADPLPADRDGQLRNCSVALWHDVRDWAVKAIDAEPGIATSLVLMSPSGQHVALCKLTSLGAAIREESSEIVSAREIVPIEQFPLSSNPCDPSQARAGCTGGIFVAAGRVDPSIARIVLQSGNRRHEIRPQQGWYALAWLDPDRLRGFPALTAYDRHGELVHQR